MPHLRDSPSRRALAACLALVLGVGAAGCDHLTDPAGPNLVDRFGPFNIVEPLGATRTAVDFAAGETVVFTAEFNKQVNWTVRITGQESGAVKVIEGFSRTLDGDNARWDGSTTALPLFKDEPVEAVLVVDEDGAEETTTEVAVTTPRDYPGAVFTAFETRDGLTVGDFEFEFDGTSGLSAEVPPAQGDAFYLLRGADNVVRNFFVGLVDIRAPGGGLFDVPTTVPENLYFNFFLRAFDTEHTIAVIQLITDGNGTGAYELDRDTVFPFGDIPVEGEGWRAYAKPVSELGLSAEQASQIVAVRLVLISNANTQPSPSLPVAFGVDYITFTSGGPLEI